LRRALGQNLSSQARQLWSHVLGALVPVTEFDFGCRDPLFGGEPTLQKARPDPAGEPVVMIANRVEPWLIQRKESMPWQDASYPPLSDYSAGND
jgi:hypothetical protein